jgi:peptide-methionine (R)-S-oxide reductase
VPLRAPELAAAAARERAHGVSDMGAEKNASPPGVLRWKDVVELARRGNVAPPRRVEKSDAEWREALTREQYDVARRKGTERPFSSEMCSLFEPGRYHCVCCDTPLFDSTTKFESGTGWPSFTAPLTPDVVAYHSDASYGMERIETTCNVCDAHLGHVFPDGPAPSGLRFCINAVSLRKAKGTF